MTKNEYLKQKLLFPVNMLLEHDNDKFKNWGFNYHPIAQDIFLQCLHAIEVRRIKCGVREYKKLMLQTPLYIMQAIAFRKCMDHSKLKVTSSFYGQSRLRFTASEKKIFSRGPLTKEEVEIQQLKLQEFADKPDNYPRLDTRSKFLSKIKHHRRLVSDLSYLAACHTALRMIVRDTVIDDKNYDKHVIFRKEYPVRIDLQDRVKWVVADYMRSIKKRNIEAYARKSAKESLKGFKAFLKCPRGKPKDLLGHYLFLIVRRYLKQNEGFSKRQIAFLMAKLGIFTSCDKCNYNGKNICPKIFMDPPENLPCLMQYKILSKSYEEKRVS